MFARIAALLLTAALFEVVWAEEPVPIKSLPFSPARQAGNTLYISGQLPRTPEGKEVRESVEAETRQVMDNLGRLLQEHGYTFENLVSVTVYLASMEYYQEMNKAYASYFKNGFPARACVGGVEIAFGFRVEISGIAYKELPIEK